MLTCNVFSDRFVSDEEMLPVIHAYYRDRRTCPHCRNGVYFLPERFYDWEGGIDPTPMRCNFCGWTGCLHELLPRDTLKWRRRVRRYKVKSFFARYRLPWYQWYRLCRIWHVWYVRAQLAARGFGPSSMRGKSVWQMCALLNR